jgi:alpha-ketoglutarate-dependent taurine dioxygenase
MKTKHLMSGKNVVALKILENDVMNTDPVEVAKLLAEYGAVVFKNVITPVKEYAEWQLEFGYHRHANIWCCHKDYPIFYRVTNQQLTENEKGLFGHGELDWHQNVLFVPNSEELVGLYGLEVEGVAPTILSNSIPMWKNFTQAEKDFYSNVRMRTTNKSEDTYGKKMAHYVLPTDEQKDFEKNRILSHISNCINFDSANTHLYPELEFQKKNFLKLKPIHPLGTDGLYFPMLNIEYMADENNEKLPNHKEVYDRLKYLHTEIDDYIYTHNWEKGDIFLMEQLVSMHKRGPVDPTKIRELLRIAAWYKTPLRKTFLAPLK